ncbi:unnamed protein product [Paramecium primaurelia]|uniref:Uncharacterized protein n=1 Tax=Paramecium primaurelia TaxID=5886 RepID=A0A8S1LT32_PARPR|nr:unnamed protein product [Paramecium primaurelia]
MIHKILTSTILIKEFKKYHNRTKEKETIVYYLSKFYEDSLIKCIRYAPQFFQIKEQANIYNIYGVLEYVEFKELKPRQGINFDPKQQLSIKDLDSPTRSPNKILTTINISKPIMKIKKNSQLN